MTTPITLADKRAELRTELGYRKRVFPRLVADGRMTQAEADRRMAVMQAILDEDLAEPDLFTGAAP